MQLKTAKDRVTELEEALQTASPTRKELLEVELAAAIARRDQICDPAYEEKLNTAIQETLDSWRTERDKLRELSATDSDSSESVTILIAQIGKTLDYIDKVCGSPNRQIYSRQRSLRRNTGGRLQMQPASLTLHRCIQQVGFFSLIIP